MLFVSDYLKKGARNGGWSSLRTLYFDSLYIDEDVSFFAEALFFGGGGGPAPNLEELSFESLEEDTIELLGSDLFARGALANITTLTFTSVDFTKQSMAALIDGYRKSGHEGRHLKRLLFFDGCSVNDESVTLPAKASFPLIDGLRDGLPNLKELWMLGGKLVVQEVAEMVEMVRGGAPCARTLRTVALSKKCEPADIEVLQAMVTLG